MPSKDTQAVTTKRLRRGENPPLEKKDRASQSNPPESASSSQMQSTLTASSSSTSSTSSTSPTSSPLNFGSTSSRSSSPFPRSLSPSGYYPTSPSLSSTPSSSLPLGSETGIIPPCCTNPPPPTPPPACSHLSRVKKDGIAPLRTVHQYIQASKHGLYRLQVPSCFVCKAVTGKIYICVKCVHIACFEHAHAHSQERRQHTVAIEYRHEAPYCFECRDFVYDWDLDLSCRLERADAMTKRRKIDHPSDKYPHPRFVTTEDMDLLSSHSRPYAIPMKLRGLRGLVNMGQTCFMNCILQTLIHNPLLSSYFLSDLHNRDECARSQAKRAGGGGGGTNGGGEDGVERVIPCLACALDGLFCEAYSGIRAPYTPHHLLSAIWQYADTFAGYEQQDAHEFLTYVLNGVHAHSGGTSHNCQCVIHQLFSGVLRSDLTCKSCGSTSTAYDPLHDISLDIPKPEETIHISRSPSPMNLEGGKEEEDGERGRERAVSSSSSSLLGSKRGFGEVRPEEDGKLEKGTDSSSSSSDRKRSYSFLSNGGVGPNVVDPPVERSGAKSRPPVSLYINDEESSRSPFSSPSSSPQSPPTPFYSPSGANGSQGVTLTDCLTKYTHPEMLHCEEKVLCSNCSTYQDSTKQLSLHQLPVVLCLHLKRFKQTLMNRKASVKVETFVEFPYRLDMHPYTSAGVKNDKDADQNSSSYELFAIVNHHGKIDNGHYTNYICLKSKQWIKCDDSWLTCVSPEEVFNSNAYLLFYMKEKIVAPKRN